VGVVLPFAPSNFVNLLLNLHALEVVELGLVALKLSPKLVLTSLFLSAHESSSKKRKGKRKRKKKEKKEKNQQLVNKRRKREVVTPSSRSKRTTRPPLSPVARCLPLSSNSTVEIMSAIGIKKRRKRKKKKEKRREKKQRKKERMR